MIIGDKVHFLIENIFFKNLNDLKLMIDEEYLPDHEFFYLLYMEAL